MALTPSEIALIEELKAQHDARYFLDEKYYRYYRLKQRIEQLGMAIPPDMRRFLVVANWPRVVVRTITGRQKVRSLILPGEETADQTLRDIWDASNLSAQTRMFRVDKYVCGRAFMSVGTNEQNPKLPLVRVESPREMEAMVDTRREEMTAAARFYGTDKTTGMGPTNVTLYLPEGTIWVAKGADGRWYEVDRDMHELGAVPVLMDLNNRVSDGFEGESELTDIIGLTDSVARSLTNLQFAQEAHGIPRMWMAGVKPEEFVGADGKPTPMFEAYFDAIHTITDPAGKVGQLTAADLKNFETALRVYGTQAAVSYGFPARYFGITTSNPPTEGQTRADENDLVNYVEDKNEAEGMVLGWMGALAYRFATGDWVEGNRVRVDYHDPATPAMSQREDALAKRRAAGVLSREGYWDELGWSEARKSKERAYLEKEAREADPYLNVLNAKDAADGGAEPAADGV